MRFNNSYFLILPLAVFFVLGCEKAKTVEYYNTHEKERNVRIEQCKKMNPVDRQHDQDCQAAIRAWSIAENKRFFGPDKKRVSPLDKPSRGPGFVDFK